MDAKVVQLVEITRLKRKKNWRSSTSVEEDAELDRSVLANGILQPVHVHVEVDEDGELTFVPDDGNRRVASAERCGLKEVPCLVDPRQLTLAESIQKAIPLNSLQSKWAPLDQAEAIHELMGLNRWSQAQTAAKLGIPPSKVSDFLGLLEMSPDIKQEIAAGHISASTAAEIARAGDKETQARLARQVLQNGLSRDGVAQLVKAAKNGERRSGPVVKATAKLGGGRTVTVSGAGLASLADLIQWLEELLVKARKERKARGRSLELATFCSLLNDEAKAATRTPPADAPGNGGGEDEGPAVAVRA